MGRVMDAGALASIRAWSAYPISRMKNHSSRVSKQRGRRAPERVSRVRQVVTSGVGKYIALESTSSSKVAPSFKVSRLAVLLQPQRPVRARRRNLTPSPISHIL